MFYILLADVSKLLVQTGIQFCCMFFFSQLLCAHHLAEQQPCVNVFVNTKSAKHMWSCG